MAHVFTFDSGQFRKADERANPINPIAGEGVLKWLAAQLTNRGVEVGVPDPEDWGWYIHVVMGSRRYLLGASGEWERADQRSDWTVQLELTRSLWEKLFASNRMQPDDVLSGAIEEVLTGNAEFRNVAVDRGA
jgi:hypothetical protein